MIQASNIGDIVQNYGITFYFMDLTGQARGCSMKCEYGYVVIIEETLSDEIKMQTLIHEVLHIYMGHLDNDIKSDDEKEAEVTEILRNDY